jgi:hypothetical protein
VTPNTLPARQAGAGRCALLGWRLRQRYLAGIVKSKATYLDAIDDRLWSAALWLYAFSGRCYPFLILAPGAASETGATFWLLPITLGLSRRLSALDEAFAANPLTFLSTHAPQLSVGLLRLRFCPDGELPRLFAAVDARLDVYSWLSLRKTDGLGGDDAAEEVARDILK